MAIIDTTFGQKHIQVIVKDDSIMVVTANNYSYSFIAPGFVENAPLNHKGMIARNRGADSKSSVYLLEDSILIIAPLDFKYRIKPFFFLVGQKGITPICREGETACNNFITGEMNELLLDVANKYLYTHSGETVEPGSDTGYRTIFKYRVTDKQISLAGQRNVRAEILADSGYYFFYTRNLF